MTRFMDMLEERHLKKEEVLTEYGEMDTNVYVRDCRKMLTSF